MSLDLFFKPLIDQYWQKYFDLTPEIVIHHFQVVVCPVGRGVCDWS